MDPAEEVDVRQTDRTTPSSPDTSPSPAISRSAASYLENARAARWTPFSRSSRPTKRKYGRRSDSPAPAGAAGDLGASEEVRQVDAWGG